MKPVAICIALLITSGCCTPRNVVPKNALVKDAEIEIVTPWGHAKLRAAEIDTREPARKAP